MEPELAAHEVKEDVFKLAAGERKRRPAGARLAPTRWRSHRAQWRYISKLLDALRRARRVSTYPSAPPGSRAVRGAADRALAVAARGRTRWSRAILHSTTGRGLKLRRINRSRGVARVGARPRKTWPPPPAATKKAPAKAVKGKAKALGWLVPGCRKLTSLPSLLDEASDYVAALEMQVRAMSALVEVLSSLGTGAAPQHRREAPGFSAC